MKIAIHTFPFPIHISIISTLEKHSRLATGVDRSSFIQLLIPLYMDNEHPKAVQDILTKLDELIDAVKQRQQPSSAVKESNKRERNPRN